jgi:hypothetical protein
MVATDGIYTTSPMPGLKISNSLGDWGHKPSEQVYDDMFIVQPGLYFFPSKLDALHEQEIQEKADDPAKALHASIEQKIQDKAEAYLKSRGFHRSLVYTFQKDFEWEWQEYLFNRFAAPTTTENTAPSVTITYSTFIGLELAMAREQKPVREAMIANPSAADGPPSPDDYDFDDGNDDDDVSSDDDVLSDEDKKELETFFSGGMPIEIASAVEGVRDNASQRAPGLLSEYLTQAGKWIEDKKEVCFDWSNKRARKSEIWGESLKLFPHDGAIDEVSVPYDRDLLKGIHNLTLEVADLPNFFQILDDNQHDTCLVEERFDGSILQLR